MVYLFKLKSDVFYLICSVLLSCRNVGLLVPKEGFVFIGLFIPTEEVPYAAAPEFTPVPAPYLLPEDNKVELEADAPKPLALPVVVLYIPAVLLVAPPP
jgi:hypothetical protein